MTARALLPCPFCGGTDLFGTSNGLNSSFIECSDCGASGPVYDDEDSDAAAWNRRAPSLEGQAVRCDAIPKHDWQELSCEPGLYEPSMESGYKRCKRCGTRVHFIRERTDQSKDKP